MNQDNRDPDVVDAYTREWIWRSGVVFIVLALLGALIYASHIQEVMAILMNRRDASHGYLIPFISVYFIWEKRHVLKALKPDLDILRGSLIVFAGILLFLFCYDADEVSLPVLSYLIVTIGLFSTFFGKKVFMEILFPLIFLVTLVPFPQNWYLEMGKWFREVGITSVYVLQLLDLTIYREGYTVFLPNCQVEVVHGCSGIRYLLPYFVLGLAYAYLYKKTTKSRILTVLATIPLSLIATFLRLFMVFLGIYYWGCFVAGRPHIWISWFVFLLVMIIGVTMDIVIANKLLKRTSVKNG